MRRTPGSSTLERGGAAGDAQMHSFDASTRLLQTAFREARKTEGTVRRASLEQEMEDIRRRLRALNAQLTAARERLAPEIHLHHGQPAKPKPEQPAHGKDTRTER